MTNGLELVGKTIDEVKLVVLGRRRGGARLPRSAGRARRASARTSSSADIEGVVYKGREKLMDRCKARLRAGDRRAHAGRRDRRRRHLPRPVGRRRAEAGDGQARWRATPLILALANPTPEIMPELAPRGAARRHDLHRPLATIRTRSTTSCASPTSSAARSTSARPTINEAMKHRRGRARSPRWRARRRRRSWRAPMAARRRRSAATT